MPVLRPGLPIRPPLGPLLLRVLLFVPDMWGVVQKGRVGTEQLLCSSGETTWNIIGQNGPPRTPLFRRWDASRRKRGERLPCAYAQLMTPTIALCS